MEFLVKIVHLGALQKIWKFPSYASLHTPIRCLGSQKREGEKKKKKLHMKFFSSKFVILDGESHSNRCSSSVLLE